MFDVETLRAIDALLEPVSLDVTKGLDLDGRSVSLYITVEDAVGMFQLCDALDDLETEAEMAGDFESHENVPTNVKDPGAGDRVGIIGVKEPIGERVPVALTNALNDMLESHVELPDTLNEIVWCAELSTEMLGDAVMDELLVATATVYDPPKSGV